MPRKSLKPKECRCGCGEFTAQKDFKPGHDQKMLSDLIADFGNGSVLGLNKFLRESKHNQVKQNLEVA